MTDEDGAPRHAVSTMDSQAPEHSTRDSAPTRRYGAVKVAAAVVVAGALALIGITALQGGGGSKAPTRTQLSAQGGLLDTGSGLLGGTAAGATGGGTAAGTTGGGTATGGGAAAPAKPAAAGTKSVMIMNYAFSPASLTVSVGDTVTWTNEDTAPHTVTVTNGPVKFDSGTLQKGQSFSYTFTVAGTYSYYCAVHPDMVASVTVTGGTGGGGTGTPRPTASPSTAPTSSSTPCGALDASVNAFLAHFYAAHLNEGLGQQLGDILNITQYVTTHLVLIENMIEPQITAVLTGSQAALNVFLQHVYTAHLERSLSGQVADVADLDQYVKTHTVLIEDMLKPFATAEVGSC